MKKHGWNSFAHLNILCVIGFAFLSVAPMLLRAADFSVPAQYPTIQSAIDVAVADDVIIVQPGTYTENINFNGKAITVKGTDPLDPAIVAATIIDGNMSGSVVTFNSGETSKSVLTGFTIRNGNGTLNATDGKRYGGGIYCAGQASPTIKHNKITGNTADIGGGIYIHGNTAPTIATGPNASYPYAGIGQTVTISLTASDIDGDTLTYSWNAREGGNITGSGNTISFSAAFPGVKHIDVTIDDGHGGTVKGTATVTVIGITLQTLPQLLVGQSSTLSAILTPVVSDTSEYPLSVTWSITQGPAAGDFDSSVNGTPLGSSITFTPSASGPGRVQVEYRVGTAVVTNIASFSLNPVITSLQPASALQGDTVEVVFSGNNLGRVNGISIGSGVTATLTEPATETTLHARLMLNVDAEPGSRTIILFTPEGNRSVSAVFQISALPAVTVNPSILSLTTGLTENITLSIPDAAPAGGLSVILSSSNANVATVTAIATIPAGEKSVVVAVNAVARGTATITANVAGYARGQAIVSVINLPLITFSPLSLNIAAGLTEPCTVTISNPAPAGGLTVTLTGSSGNVYVPTSLTIPANSMSASFSVRGLSAGASTITARAANYPDGILQTTVIQGQLVLSPASLPVAVGRPSTLTLSIPNNAPPGGLTVNLTSSNPAYATVPATVNVPENTKSVTIQVTGVGAGTATITAAASGFANGQATINVQQYSIAFAPTSLIITPGTSKTAEVVLSKAAPDGGLNVSFTSPAPTLVSVPTSVMIPAGQTRATINVAGLDTTSAPVMVLASAGGISEAQLSVTVQQKIQPVVKADIIVGTRCRSNGLVELSNGVLAPVGGYTINLTSSDSLASVPATVTIPQGSNSTIFSISGAAPGSALIIASAGGYTSAGTVTVVKASLQWNGTIPQTVTVGSIYRYGIDVGINVPNGSTYYISGKQMLSRQYAAESIPVELTPSNPAVIQIPLTVIIPAGNYDSDDVSIKGVDVGTSTITASAINIDGAVSSPVTVGNPRFGAELIVGTGCRTTGSVSLVGGVVPPYGSYTFNLSSSDPTVATVPATVTIPEYSSNGTFNIVGHSIGTATITISSDRYTAANTVTVVRPALQWNSVPGQITVGATSAMGLRTFVPNGTCYSNSDYRYGNTSQVVDQPLTVSLMSSDASVLQPPSAITIPAGSYSNNSINVQAVGAGSAFITATVPGWDGATSAAIGTTSPWLKADITVGTGCRSTGTIGLTGSTAPTGGYVVTLSSSDPAIATVPATATIPQGNSYISFNIVGHKAGTADITMSVGAFTVKNTVTVVQSGFAWRSAVPSQMTLGTVTNFYFSTNVPNGSYYSASSKYLNNQQVVEQSQTTILSSSDASIIQVPAGVTIAAGSSGASFSVQAVGVGSSMVTVSADGWDSLASYPVSTVGPLLKADVTVGSGCSTTGVVSLTGGTAPTGGYTVTLTSSDPSILSVPTTATIAQGNSSYVFTIVGHNPGTAAITVNVGSFTTTVTATVVTPQFQFQGMPGGMNIGASASISVYTYVPGGTRYYTDYYSYIKYENHYNQPIVELLTINLTSTDPLVIQAPTTAIIPAGYYYTTGSISVQAIGAGAAGIIAEAPGWNRTVSPRIYTIDWLKADVTVGAGCRTTGSVGMATGSAPTGGYTVGLMSDNPVVASVPETVTIPQYSSYVGFKIVGHNPGTATIRMTSPTGHTSIGMVTVVKPILQWNDNGGQIAVGASASMNLQVYVPDGTYYYEKSKYDNSDYQSVDQPLTVTISSSDAAVIQSTTAVIEEGDYRTYAEPVAIGLGTGTITASAPNCDSATSGLITTIPPYLHTNVSVGIGCQAYGMVGFDSGGAPVGGTVFMLSSSDPAVAEVPTTMTVNQYSSSGVFPIVGRSAGTTTITATLGALVMTSQVNVVEPSFHWEYVPSHVSVGTSAYAYLSVRVDGDTQQVADDLEVEISSEDPLVIQVPASVTIPRNSSYARIDFVASDEGKSSITASAPAWQPQVTGSINTSNGPWFAADVTVGAGLKTTGIVGTGNQPAPSGGLTLALASSDPSIATVPGTVTIPEDSSLANFVIVGHSPGTATIMMDNAGILSTSTVQVVKPGLSWNNAWQGKMYMGVFNIELYTYVPGGAYYSSTGYRYENTNQVVDQSILVTLESLNTSVVQLQGETATMSGAYTSVLVNNLSLGTSVLTASGPDWDNTSELSITVIEGEAPGY